VRLEFYRPASWVRVSEMMRMEQKREKKVEMQDRLDQATGLRRSVGFDRSSEPKLTYAIRT
jgi:hypothetical protein